MRNKQCFNSGWVFSREDVGADVALEKGKPVTLPHTWNAQDGTEHYYRGRCWYAKRFPRPETESGDEVWLEFEGVAMVAEVYCNGQLLGRHEGGYSTFRVNLTPALEDDNLLVVSADNSFTDRVYPQRADFTFYGGVYRDVWLITVPQAHFALGYHGGPGIKVTPRLEGRSAEVTLEAWLENAADGNAVRFAIDGVGETVAATENGKAEAVLRIENTHLWDGVDDPYLYTARAGIGQGGDVVETHFGCRSFHFDPEQGFFLNGCSYPLCGAARHQDREGVGSALTPEMHRADMALLREMGANTVRLAHYQHAQYFYDLCDEAGMVVWAEIPYITWHVPEANENTQAQMRELVVQNYNHPSVVCWGLSNEITITTGETEDLLENHQRLHTLCHSLDTTRPTTIANVYTVDTGSPLLQIPDIRSYNLYNGWYQGEVADTAQWFDDFHASYPDMVIGLSEYGADANPRLQSPRPKRGDYTEGYQALLHEQMLEIWAQRPYIWAMHVWNMFDFAADGRDEGGRRGINQKGLVTFDRKTKKDAFYIYKAYLSQTPFVHLCGSRYADRAEDVTEVKVYSNQPRVTLYVDGAELETQTGDKIFRFSVPLTGEHTIEARAGGCADSIQIRRVAEPNPAYVLQDATVTNWFEADALTEAGYTIRDKIGDIKKSPEGEQLLARFMGRLQPGGPGRDEPMPESMQRMLNNMSLERMLKASGAAVSEADIRQLNKQLNQIIKQ